MKLTVEVTNQQEADKLEKLSHMKNGFVLSN